MTFVLVNPTTGPNDNYNSLLLKILTSTDNITTSWVIIETEHLPAPSLIQCPLKIGYAHVATAARVWNHRATYY